MAILRGERTERERSRNANAVGNSVNDTPKGSFPKTAHLLKHPDFQRVYQQGRRHFSGNMTVFYLRALGQDVQGLGIETEAAPVPNGAGTAGRVRVGFTVSKALGGSVERNRMRRRTREAVRRHLPMLQGISGAWDVVINPKKSLLKAEFLQISQEIERAFRVIRQYSLSSANGVADKGGKQEARRR